MKTLKFSVTMAVVLLALPGMLYAQELLQPGDSIGEMSLRAGGADGPPLWAFCSPAFLNLGLTTTECAVPPLPEVAIGHGEWFADEALRDSNWSVMTWELYLDGQQIDLAAFGTYDDDLPQTGLPGHDPDEEVVTKLRTYDVVLVNPTLGEHALRSVLTVSEETTNGFYPIAAGTYELVVNFTVAVPAPALPQTGGSTPAKTPQLWIAAAGLLVLIAGLGLQRGFRRT